MPPKGHARRPSTSAAKDAATIPPAVKATKNTSMPPPPNPPPPLGILEAEMKALSSCLRNATVKTGQIYGFYADAQRLGVHKYAPYPPRSLTAALGREVEKYDHLCDAMESHLLRAITVLRRDIRQEEQRIKAKEEAAAAVAAAKVSPPEDILMVSASPPGSPGRAALGVEQTAKASGSGPQANTPSAKPIAPRRQSTISLSSLQRPAFPHKLDLSAATLRINPEEILPSGLSSPVTLAPKSSARTLPPDLLVAALNDASGGHVDIDLTTDMDMQSVPTGMDPSLGSSPDKPIELDFDVGDMDILNETDVGNSSAPVPDMLYSGAPGPANHSMRPPADIKPKVEDEIGLDILNALNAADNSGDGSDIFASLGAHSDATHAGNAAHMEQRPSSAQKLEPVATPSPASILASFGAASNPDISSSLHGEHESFDLNNIDLSNLSSHLDTDYFGEHAAAPDMTMMDFFGMGNAEAEKPANPQPDANAST